MVYIDTDIIFLAKIAIMREAMNHDDEFFNTKIAAEANLYKMVNWSPVSYYEKKQNSYSHEDTETILSMIFEKFLKKDIDKKNKDEIPFSILNLAELSLELQAEENKTNKNIAINNLFKMAGWSEKDFFEKQMEKFPVNILAEKLSLAVIDFAKQI